MSEFNRGPFDPDELVRWAENYGHPEEWAKKAQALHGQNEALRVALQRIYDALSESPSAGFAICDTVDGIHNPCWCRQARRALEAKGV